jgi:hypothetical protein
LINGRKFPMARPSNMDAATFSCRDLVDTAYQHGSEASFIMFNGTGGTFNSCNAWTIRSSLLRLAASC